MRSLARIRLAVFALLSIGTFAACGPAGPRSGAAGPGGAPGVAGAPGQPGGLQVAGSPGAGACAEPPGAANDPRTRGIDAFLEGRAREAAGILAEVVRARPADAAAEVFRQASVAKLETANAGVAGRAEDVPAVALERIPLARAAGAAPLSGPKVRLEKKSEAKNLIVDDEDWLQKNGLAPRQTRGARDLPEHVGSRFRDHRLGTLFHAADHHVGEYGSFLVATAPGRRPRVFDASAAILSGPRPFEVVFAQLAGGTLFVELAYNGYAKDSGNKNGYVAAFDARSGRLLWSSDPLTGNFTNFHIAGGSLIVGYGFTAEPDHLFVLDVATGAVDQKIPIASGPSWILTKGDEVHVRTYDTNYVFRVAGGAMPATPPAAFDADPGAAQAPRLDPQVRCWAHVAAAAIERKDARALGEAMEGLAPLSGDRTLFDALGRERKRLAERERGEARLDLTTAQPIVLPKPPWGYALFANAPAAVSKPPLLVKLAGGDADPVRALRKEPFRPDLPFFIAPVQRGALPPGARRDIPSQYALEDLRAIIPSGDRLLLVYGGRYLVSVTGHVVERIFDLDAFRHPPDPNPQWKEFAIQDVTYAQVADGAVYVCNGGGSYAREVKGKKGFVSAIDLASGRLLWRSEPLVCNATFVMAGDHLVTGYGFTDEPDFVFLLRKADGKVVQKVRVDSGPSTISMEGNRVTVEAYSNRYLFELRPQ